MASVNWFLSLCMFMLVLFALGQPTHNQFPESSGALEPTNASEKDFIIDCDPQHSSSECDGWTLNRIAKNAADATHVHIEMNISHLQLTGRVVFEHHESVTIIGENTVISCMGSDSGLQLIDINKVTISGITLTNCGTPYENSSYYHTIY